MADKETNTVIKNNLEIFNRKMKTIESFNSLGKEEFSKMIQPLLNNKNSDDTDQNQQYEELQSPKTFCISNLKCIHDLFSIDEI